ncbi:aminomethyl-transferring glycine dehydrogenase subunit GcvPB [Lutibaculum baratangense]|uniref:glycine dehydrogenase (aminomethyl-transferring) n=1 Tax=Lutibaculum baratangense AMV1 TaxID=631454 RepID=V4RJF0_9HYPH|nr:aminomethyl-transferring glycine dehydrogenase subunit GcvPB [Lutibaculum baratangense]ESR26226.1 Glycine dehydrogenase [decarboxylating] (glycine cleavage system P2 protein) [Lutibaculum baratangense AMV1]
MTMNRQGRQTAGEAGTEPADRLDTFTGNRGLRIEEPLIFEYGRERETGVDLPAGSEEESLRLGGLERRKPLDLPGLSEPETMRHYVRLSRSNYAIDSGIYPLGSCTMKHNPRLNEAVARLPGLSDIHPLQPVSTVQGALELIDTLAHWLKVATGLPAVAMSPKAGAHGELCGMMAIKAAHQAKGDARSIVLVPESAHGTNPATAALLGYKVETVPAREDGTVDPEAVRSKMSPQVAALMLTNPNTCGLFEPDVIEIAKAVHEAGAYFYCDGANFNAIQGRVRPGDLGVDAMHINLHKTFSTPHGGGGPGAGPVVLSEALAPFAPLPWVVSNGEQGFDLVEHAAEGDETRPFGRMTAFHGQMGMFVRALAWMMSHGSDGMRQAAEDAVLSANYVRACLSDLMSVPFPDHPSMHEVLFDDGFLYESDISTLDIAKALIDEGFHPMTIYFPLVVHGAMLIEPTESESKASLDLFVATLRDLVIAAKRGDRARFADAPRYAPRRRLDETTAARKPILCWLPRRPQADAAE